MQESDFGAKFQQWWKLNRFCENAAFEYKITKTGTYNLNEWHKKQPHQYIKLKKATTDEGVIWKISDLDPRSKPFDGFFISNADAFLVVMYYKWGQFFMIPVHDIPAKLRFHSHGVKNDLFRMYCCRKSENNIIYKSSTLY